MYVLNAGNVKKMTIKYLSEFIFENYYTRLGFTKEDSIRWKSKKKRFNENKYHTLVELKNKIDFKKRNKN